MIINYANTEEQFNRHQKSENSLESHVRGRSREAANSRLNGRHASSGCRYMSPPPSIYTTWTMHVRVNLDATETKEFSTACYIILIETF